MNFRLKSGTIGSVQTSCFTHDHGDGAMGIYLDIASRDKTYRFKNHQMDLIIQSAHKQKNVFDSHGNPLLIENQAFLAVLQTQKGQRILSPYADAIESLKVSLAADISIVEKRSVKICEL